MRTDIHRPSEAEYGNYECAGIFYCGHSEEMNEAYAEDNKEHDRLAEILTEFQGNYVLKGTCDHCGSAFSHGVVYIHRTEGILIRVGHTCAENSFKYDSRTSKLRADRERAAQIRKQEKANAESVYARYPDLKPIFEEDLGEMHRIISDIRSKALRYGSLSDAQHALVLKIHKQEQERKAARLEAEGSMTPVVGGDGVTIDGTILTVRAQDGYYGEVVKMLIDTGNNKLWGTVPSSLLNYEHMMGRQVTFTANVRQADDDPYFGFFYRPRKASFID